MIFKEDTAIGELFGVKKSENKKTFSSTRRRTRDSYSIDVKSIKEIKDYEGFHALPDEEKSKLSRQMTPEQRVNYGHYLSSLDNQVTVNRNGKSIPETTKAHRG